MRVRAEYSSQGMSVGDLPERVRLHEISADERPFARRRVTSEVLSNLQGTLRSKFRAARIFSTEN